MSVHMTLVCLVYARRADGHLLQQRLIELRVEDLQLEGRLVAVAVNL